MPTIPSQNDTLNAKQLFNNITELTTETKSKVVTNAMLTAADIVDQRIAVDEIVQTLNADTRWSEEGRRKQLETKLAEPYKALAKHVVDLTKEIDTLEKRTPTLEPIKSDDVAGAVHASEVRGWLRSLPAEQRDAITGRLSDLDAPTLRALAGAPPALSGLRPSSWNRVAEAAVDTAQPGAVAEWRREAKALSEAARIAADAVVHVRGKLGLRGNDLRAWEAQATAGLRKPEGSTPVSLDPVQKVIAGDALHRARGDFAALG
jgi:hypothetical protein